MPPRGRQVLRVLVTGVTGFDRALLEPRHQASRTRSRLVLASCEAKKMLGDRCDRFFGGSSFLCLARARGGGYVPKTGHTCHLSSD